MTKIYTNKKEAFWRLKKIIEEEICELDVSIASIVFEDSGFTTIRLAGEDEVAADNYLGSIFGRSIPLGELKEGQTIKGYVCSSGKVGFGIFVDVGIRKPYHVDALIPLYALRNQLMKGLKVSAKKIITLFGLINNLPIEITIEKVSISLKKIEAKFSNSQVGLFEHWLEEGLDRLYILGAFKEEIEEALNKSFHRKDVIAFENLGWMENVLTCKFNTSAKGLIPEIGKRLPKAKFEIFSPSKIKKFIREQ